MDPEPNADRLLRQLDVLRRPSDLDLLMFFARHPRSLLSSDHLALLLGYGVADIAGSLDVLLNAGFLTRTQTHRHAARMYVFAMNPPGGGWLPAVRRLASTRAGRLALIWAIRRRSETGGASPVVGRADRRPALPFSPRRRAGASNRRKTIAGADAIAREPRTGARRRGDQ